MSTQFTLHSEQQGIVVFDGKILGRATSQQPDHNHDTPFVAPGFSADGRKNKCPACRWFEVTVYVTTSGVYVLHTIGKSVVPGEIEYARIAQTASAFELVDIATVRSSGKPYLPAPSSRALAQAADKDDNVRDAFINRAVV